MKKYKIVYVGNDKWCPQLKNVISNLINKVEVVLVCTQRGSETIIKLCKNSNIECVQTKNINYLYNKIKLKDPDFILVFGCPFLIKRPLLDLCPIIGTHPAKLPKRRGRAPITWTIIDGLKESAATMFYIDQGADSGPIIYQEEFTIKDNDTSLDLIDKINSIYVKMTYRLIQEFPNTPKIIQDENQATYKEKRDPEDGEINLDMSAEQIDRYVRALTPPVYPPAFIVNNMGEKIYILKVKIDKK